MKKLFFVLALILAAVAFGQDMPVPPVEEDRNAKVYQNDCSSYGELIVVVVELRKRGMSRVNVLDNLTSYLKRSNLTDAEITPLYKAVEDAYDHEFSTDYVELYINRQMQCSKEREERKL